MKAFSFIVFVFFLGIESKAQTRFLDSLQENFSHVNPESYTNFFSAADAELENLPLGKAIAIVERIGKKYEDANDIRVPYYIYRSYARLFRSKKKYLKADSVLHISILYTRDNKLIYDEAETLLALGDLYDEIYKYPEAIEYMKQAFQLYHQNGYIKMASITQTRMGLVTYRSNEGSGLLYFQQAIHIGKDSLADRDLISNYNSIGLVYEREKQYPQSIESYQKALTLATEAKDSVWIGLTMGNIGQVLVLTGKYDEALDYLLYDLNCSIRYNEFASAASTAKSIADVYIKRNKRTLALHYLQQGLELAVKSHLMSPRKKIYWSLSEFYEQEKALQKAYYYLRLYTQVNDSLVQRRKEINAIQIKSAFEVQKHKNEIATLKVVNQKKEQFLIAIGVVLMLVSTSVILGLRITQKVKFNRLLQYQKAELQDKNALLQQQQEEIEAQNEELLQSREEIEAQRDILTIQNQELYQAHGTISTQNEEILNKNQNLEEEIRKRTRKLLEYNHQLEQIAFMTAHNLRAPVARILGLGEVLRFSEPEEEKLYIEKLVDTTHELDQVLRDMNSVLENKKVYDFSNTASTKKNTKA